MSRSGYPQRASMTSFGSLQSINSLQLHLGYGSAATPKGLSDRIGYSYAQKAPSSRKTFGS